MPTNSTFESGRAGEEVASRILQKKGYKIINRNFHSKLGEIDLIAIDGKTLVFVEVKTRWNEKFGLPEEAVTPRKLRSITKAAEYYKLTHPNTPALMRIDVMALEVRGRQVIKSELFKNVTG